MIKSLKITLAGVAVLLAGMSAVRPAGAQEASKEDERQGLRCALHRQLSPSVPESCAAVRDVGYGGIVKEIKSDAVQINDIYFDLNSAELRTNDKEFLNALADVLADNVNASMRHLIVGHTDVTGTAAYNEKLSARRALSVRSYLLNRVAALHGTEAKDRLSALLETEGMGARSLLLEDRPKDPKNRRVVIDLSGGA